MPGCPAFRKAGNGLHQNDPKITDKIFFESKKLILITERQKGAKKRENIQFF
jgi:hypothetical protein